MNTPRIMSFLDEAAGKELVLPVTPAKYTWRHPNRIETVRLDQLGEVNLPGGARMGECTLEGVLLPAQLYPFCVPGARADPWGYLYDLELWSDRGTVLRWIVSGTSVNAPVLIEEITQGERDGTNDLYITIAMRQYRRPEEAVLALSSGGEETARDAGTGANSTKTYTVVKGDCMWSIAKKFYGNGSLYTRLAAANPSVKNQNLIYPGQVLTIPPLSDLPEAAAPPASAAAAAATTSVRDTSALDETIRSWKVNPTMTTEELLSFWKKT